MLMPPEQIRRLLQDRNLLRISEGSGVSYGTIQRLARGKQMTLNSDTLQKLTDYFEAQQNESITNSH